MEFEVIEQQGNVKVKSIEDCDTIKNKYNYTLTVSDINKQLLPLKIYSSADKQVKIVSFN